MLIHGQLLREDQVDSYKRLNVIPSLSPMHTFYWGDWHRDNIVGPELTIYSMPAAERGKKAARNGSKNQGEQTFARLMQAAAQSQQLAKLGVPGAASLHNPGCQNCMCVFLPDLVGAMAAQTP